MQHSLFQSCVICLSVMSQKEIVNFYFKRKADMNYYKCRCGNVRNKTERGATEIWSSTSPETIKTFWTNFAEKTTTLFPLLTQPKAKTIYCRLDWLSTRLPFNFCEKEATRKYSNLKDISSKTLTSYMTKTVKLVEKEFEKTLPDKFALMIDGWSKMGSSTHCWRLCFFPSKAGQTKYFFLTFAPLVDETSYTADNHLELLEFVLSVYNKSFENVSFIVCDNENLNKSIARKMGKLMIGCSSHCLNLAVKFTYLEFSEENELWNKLMKKLSTLKHSAIRRRQWNLRPVLKNEKRWSSIFSMLTRYFELRPFIDTKDPDLPPYVLTPQKENQIEAYLEDLKIFEFVSKKLQKEKTTILWPLLDIFIKISKFDLILAASLKYCIFASLWVWNCESDEKRKSNSTGRSNS